MLRILALSVAIGLVSFGARADANDPVKVGIVLSATGPASSLGVPQRKGASLLPTELAGRKIQFHIEDDASDPAQAVKAARKLLLDEKVDILVGPNTTVSSLAVLDVVSEAKTPMVSFAGSSRIVSPVDAKRHWVFKSVPDESLMAEATLRHMSSNGIKKLALIATGDALGDTWDDELGKLVPKFNISLVAKERYAATDVSVVAQVAKVMAAQPEAVLIAVAATPAALPAQTLREQGYKGKIYFTYAALNPEVLKLGGKKMEGAIAAYTPAMDIDHLQPNDPVRLLVDPIRKRYEAANNGQWSTNVLSIIAAWNFVEAALKETLPAQKPGSAEFRAMLRDKLEGLKDLTTAVGPVSMSKTNHAGFDQRSTALFEVNNGAWKLIAK
ncbi:MAG: hypothetical protein BGP05_02275 [Rhizobiales bacterium 62-47]|nr:ABC transporter substrate-binding protein [Hyphomicrobiales bacterium]OJY12782.1 MAG: hypothetical protein BGP05_02275 [Rhizobiales bacterium 62-47]